MKPIEAVIQSAIWDVDVGALPPWKAWGTRALRVLHTVVNDLLEGQLTLRAMSLVYTTLLSLVPLLAVSFSVLKGFGVHNQFEPILQNFLGPLGPKGGEITTSVLGFVENMQVGVLGAMGLGMLFYTVVSLIQKIESAFNYTWHTTSTRTLGQRFSNYLSVVMVGPVLMFSALGITASISNAAVVQRLTEIQLFGSAFSLVTQSLPYMLVIAAFAFVYVFVPNAHVRPRAAIVGAVIGGTLWQTTGWVFASFVAGSARYTAIYSGFAILILFMIWLYISWLILLIGASVAYYVQNPQHLVAHREELGLSSRLKDRVALLLMTRIGRDYGEGGDGWTVDSLSRWLDLPMYAVGTVLNGLEASGLLVQTAAPDSVYVPARSPERISVREVLAAVRTAEETSRLHVDRLPHDERVDELINQMESALDGSLSDRMVAGP